MSAVRFRESLYPNRPRSSKPETATRPFLRVLVLQTGQWCPVHLDHLVPFDLRPAKRDVFEEKSDVPQKNIAVVHESFWRIAVGRCGICFCPDRYIKMLGFA